MPCRAVEIVHRLSEEILKRESDLLATVDACAELDWCVRLCGSVPGAESTDKPFRSARSLMAFAGAAVNWNWKRPDMTDENVLEITKGRCVCARPLLRLRRLTSLPLLAFQAPPPRASCGSGACPTSR